MKNNLDIWNIDYCSSELSNVLNNIKDGLSIIYSNALCDYNIVNINKYNTILYNEERNIIIMYKNDEYLTKKI